MGFLGSHLANTTLPGRTRGSENPFLEKRARQKGVKRVLRGNVIKTRPNELGVWGWWGGGGGLGVRCLVLPSLCPSQPKPFLGTTTITSNTLPKKTSVYQHVYVSLFD